jgi:2-hydroxy-3-keto-5-methylthiopentenyl-1-phosphate phosphatase
MSEKTDHRLKLFIDFDGTITTLDVGDELFRQLGGEKCVRLVSDYLSERIGAPECLIRECEIVGAIRREALDAIIKQQKTDPSFPAFVRFCEDRHLEFYVLSDGFDYYIDRILGRLGLERVKYFANHLEFRPVDGTDSFFLLPVFPYRDRECERCANCKRNHLLTLSSEGDVILYIGNGYSDRCPARYADIVFAKEDLLRYCRQENISCYEFRAFEDIIERLTKILSQPRIRKRWRAELRRREAFLRG